MQLMPATAKWVAGKIGMTDFTPASVNDFDTNTELGTNYLNMCAIWTVRRCWPAPATTPARGGAQLAFHLHASGRGRDLRRDHPVQRDAHLRQERDVELCLLRGHVQRPASIPEGAAGQGRAPGRRKHHAAMTQDPATQGLQCISWAARCATLPLPAGDRDWVVVGATPEDMARRGFMPVGGDFPVFLHPRTKEEYALARTERKSGHGSCRPAIRTGSWSAPRPRYGAPGLHARGRRFSGVPASAHQRGIRARPHRAQVRPRLASPSIPVST